MADDLNFEYKQRKRKNKKKNKKLQTLCSNSGDENKTINFDDESVKSDVDFDDDLHVTSDSTIDIETSVNFVENSENNTINVNIPEMNGTLTDAELKIQSNEKFKVETSDEENGDQIVDNLRVLPKEADTYELEKFEKHAMLIFNQEYIIGYKPRSGTLRDVEALTETFGNLGFEINEHKDLTRNEIFNTLKEFSQRDFTDYGCICIVVLTHGSDEGNIRARDMEYNEQDILEFFKVDNKPTLITKPKILIIQACRGTNFSEGVEVATRGRIRTDVDRNITSYYLPVEADMLIFHSTYVGSVSYRHEEKGSWFIQTLCKYINEYSQTEHIETIFRLVKKEVAINKSHEEFNRRTMKLGINKQMPVLTSTLIRKLYFKKYNNDYVIVNDVMDTDSDNNVDLKCECYLKHYDYLRNCLRHYVEENTNDKTARSFLELSDTYEDTIHFLRAKEKMAAEICKHLYENAKDYPFYKYIYFYNM